MIETVTNALEEYKSIRGKEYTKAYRDENEPISIIDLTCKREVKTCSHCGAALKYKRGTSNSFKSKMNWWECETKGCYAEGYPQYNFFPCY